MRTQPPSRRAFTLVELLVVISIIALLVGLLFPAIKTALLKAETAKAKAMTLSIAAAFKAFDLEYGGWTNTFTNPQYVKTAFFANSRGIVFLDTALKDIATDGSGNILDPWKNPYRMACDLTGASSIANPFSGGTPAYIPASVIVWSCGPDGLSSDSLSTGGSSANDPDNVTSW